MADVTDIYWTVERSLLTPGLKFVTYHDANNGRVLGTWQATLTDEDLEAKLLENKQALINSFNGNH